MMNTFQALESKLQLAIANANQVLDSSDKADGVTADELQSAADELQKTIESVVSGGLPKAHPLVIEATNLGNSLHNEVIKRVALYVVWVLECRCVVAQHMFLRRTR